MPLTIILSYTAKDPIYDQLWASVTIILGVLIFVNLSKNSSKNISYEKGEKNKIN
jgi:hypothetical protein